MIYLKSILSILALFIVVACGRENKDQNSRLDKSELRADSGGEVQSKLSPQKRNACESLLFQGSLKDWFSIGFRLGEHFDLSRELPDSLCKEGALLLEYQLGIVLLRSTRLGSTIRLPLFTHKQEKLNKELVKEAYQAFFADYESNFIFLPRWNAQIELSTVRNNSQIEVSVLELESKNLDKINTGKIDLLFDTKKGTFEMAGLKSTTHKWF